MVKLFINARVANPRRDEKFLMERCERRRVEIRKLLSACLQMTASV
jgi:hypothetical protein